MRIYPCCCRRVQDGDARGGGLGLTLCLSLSLREQYACMSGGWILKGTHRSCGIDVANRNGKREKESGREKKTKRTPKAVKTNKMTVTVAGEGTAGGRVTRNVYNVCNSRLKPTGTRGGWVGGWGAV